MRIIPTILISALVLTVGYVATGVPTGPAPVPQGNDGPSEATQYQTRVDIQAETRAELIRILNQHLAETADLRSQAKQAHWNVKGQEFWQLHLLFDEIAGELIEYEDMLAERVTSLGGYARGTVRMAAEDSSLPEYPTDIEDGMAHVEALAERVGQYANHAREASIRTDELGDLATSDLYADISRTMDKHLWFLEAHLQGR